MEYLIRELVDCHKIVVRGISKEMIQCHSYNVPKSGIGFIFPQTMSLKRSFIQDFHQLCL
jgi:hypothetical protein